MAQGYAMSFRVGVALVAATFGGCAEELGPERIPTTRVEGSVRIAGVPVRSGWVEFVPIEGTRGTMRTSPIGPDGSFAADGVPVGRVAVAVPGVHGPAIVTPLGRVELSTFRLFQQTPIRRSTDAPTRIDLDLAAEAEAHLRRRIELARQADDPRG